MNVCVLGALPVVTRHSLFLGFLGIPPHIGEPTAAISDRNKRPQYESLASRTEVSSPLPARLPLRRTGDSRVNEHPAMPQQQETGLTGIMLAPRARQNRSRLFAFWLSRPLALRYRSEKRST
jgi:hypothetical protein